MDIFGVDLGIWINLVAMVVVAVVLLWPRKPTPTEQDYKELEEKFKRLQAYNQHLLEDNKALRRGLDDVLVELARIRMHERKSGM